MQIYLSIDKTFQGGLVFSWNAINPDNGEEYEKRCQYMGYSRIEAMRQWRRENGFAHKRIEIL